MRLAGHDWHATTSVIVCNHVYEGSEVRTVQVDEDGLCFQCGGPDDDPLLAKVVCLDCVIDRPGLHDVPDIPLRWKGLRELDGTWSIIEQIED